MRPSRAVPEEYTALPAAGVSDQPISGLKALATRQSLEKRMHHS